MGDHRGAALLVRVWLEDAGDFRARLLTLPDATGGRAVEETTVAVASSPAAVLDAVRDWLERLPHQAVGPPDGGQ
ncbi:hypothetical protein QOZ88_02990 [Blastococcus sp. BMG 814]|uniref:Uncharacterized protein n=1 Tax=Blastococcus carthaginiensis TaxID=3050034 RepID=A0ABT9I7Q5_9ACTN|nr:hypothetical protein [Blastococcus carthaginiensis]MDP5181591.1 hypothetical protein [Blastococcus carthaginiensis]